jgi:hypothetical protein
MARIPPIVRTAVVQGLVRRLVRRGLAPFSSSDGA